MSNLYVCWKGGDVEVSPQSFSSRYPENLFFLRIPVERLRSAVSIGGIDYDAAGNTTVDSFHTYLFSGGNQLASVDNGSTATYVYDAQGRRVQKKTSAGTVDYLYDLSGHQAAEVSSTGAWNRGEIYAAGRHLVTYSGGNSGTTYFDFTDWLGTERVRTDPTMATKETCTNLPFGDSQTCTGTNVSPLAFTGQQYDSEDNFTNFQFRQHDATQGRWLTTDPSGLAAVDPTNPQTWNRYAYAVNNPANNVDPLGLEEMSPVEVGSGGCGSGGEDDSGDTGDDGDSANAFRQRTHAYRATFKYAYRSHN